MKQSLSGQLLLNELLQFFLITKTVYRSVALKHFQAEAVIIVN